MELDEKLKILGDSAKHDVSCTSSGSTREAKSNGMGTAVAGGICHTWTSDGRCISLFKVLFTNFCIYDCAYCINRRSNDHKRTSFTVDELVSLTINFYRRNYIEGLFLSSGIIGSPDYTMNKLIEVAKKLRTEEHFNGYIHLKMIPGANEKLITRAGHYADRVSINIELPTEKSLNLLAPQKEKKHILGSMQHVQSSIEEIHHDRKYMRHTPLFVPAGQSTQLIIGATPESDYQILNLTSSLYKKYRLRRVYYSAYDPVNSDSRLPSHVIPPLTREHRLYQADWLLRFYHFDVDEILSSNEESLDSNLDPKAAWAVKNPHHFPLEINKADYEMLLRVPGIGVLSAQKIVAARRTGRITFEILKKLHINLKQAQHFVTCCGKSLGGLNITPEAIRTALVPAGSEYFQPGLFE